MDAWVRDTGKNAIRQLDAEYGKEEINAVYAEMSGGNNIDKL